MLAVPRRNHILKKNNINRAPRRIIWVDTEALNEHGRPESGRQTLFFGVALYDSYKSMQSDIPQSQDSLLFDGVDGFWDWVESKTVGKRSLWVMAHNWNYDAGILNASGLIQRGWNPTKYINGKPPLIVRMVKNEATILLVDTLNYFRTSLVELGLSVGLPKEKMPEVPGDHRKITDLSRWHEYAWRDVEIIRLAFLAFRTFVRNHNLGVLQPTLASQAFTAYRHRFMPEKIVIHANEKALSLERESFHGGRTEAFYHGWVDGPVHKLDINSMYPAIMAREQFGHKLLAYFGYAQQLWWEDALKAGHSMVAQCKIETDIPVYGLVKDERLVFPVGEFDTTLSTPEIIFALAHGHILSVGAWAIYEQANLFRGFVEFFVGIRAEYRSVGNEAFQYMAKILMNSLYGKWGQNGRKWIETEEFRDWRQSNSEEWFLLLDTWYKLRTRLGKTQVLKSDSESENSAPIIAAEITAYGRVWLWELIEKAGLENVYYVDTDSLFTNETGLRNLSDTLDPALLGKLKVEGVSTKTCFLAPKHYYFDGRWTIKGISRNASPVYGPHPKGIVAVYDQETFHSWDRNLKHGTDGFIDVVPIRKEVTGINTKRVYTVDGWTSPIVLTE